MESRGETRKKRKRRSISRRRSLRRVGNILATPRKVKVSDVRRIEDEEVEVEAVVWRKTSGGMVANYMTIAPKRTLIASIDISIGMSTTTIVIIVTTMTAAIDLTIVIVEMIEATVTAAIDGNTVTAAIVGMVEMTIVMDATAAIVEEMNQRGIAITIDITMKRNDEKTSQSQATVANLKRHQKKRLHRRTTSVQTCLSTQLVQKK